MSTGVEGWELFERVKEALFQRKGLFPKSTLGLNSLPSCSERKKLGVNLDSSLFLLYSTYSNPTGITLICAPKRSPLFPLDSGLYRKVKEGRYIKRLGSVLLFLPVVHFAFICSTMAQGHHTAARRGLVEPPDGRSCAHQHGAGMSPGWVSAQIPHL